MQFLQKFKKVDDYKNMSFNDLKQELNINKKKKNKPQELILRKLMKQKYLECIKNKQNNVQDIDELLKLIDEGDKEDKEDLDEKEENLNKENLNKENLNKENLNKEEHIVSFRPEMSNDIKQNNTNSSFNIERLQGDIFIRDLNFNQSASQKKPKMVKPYDEVIEDKNQISDTYANY